MTKFYSRLVLLALLPGLIVDPGTAHAFLPPATARPSAAVQLCRTQAIVPAMAVMRMLATGLGLKRSPHLHLTQSVVAGESLSDASKPRNSRRYGVGKRMEGQILRLLLQADLLSPLHALLTVTPWVPMAYWTYSTPATLVRKAKLKGVDPVDLSRQMFAAKDLESFFHQLKHEGLLPVRSRYHQQLFSVFAVQLWNRHLREPLLSHFPTSPIGERFGFASRQITVGSRTFHVIGVVHGQWDLHVHMARENVPKLVADLKTSNIQLLSEQHFPALFNYDYGVEMEDAGLSHENPASGRSGDAAMEFALNRMPESYWKRITSRPACLWDPQSNEWDRSDFAALNALFEGTVAKGDVVLLIGRQHLLTQLMALERLQIEQEVRMRHPAIPAVAPGTGPQSNPGSNASERKRAGGRPALWSMERTSLDGLAGLRHAARDLFHPKERIRHTDATNPQGPKRSPQPAASRKEKDSSEPDAKPAAPSHVTPDPLLEEVKSFVLEMNPFLQSILMERFRGFYPEVCRSACYIARRVLVKRFGGQIQIHLHGAHVSNPANEFPDPVHEFLEVIVRDESYFLSFTEGQHRMPQWISRHRYDEDSALFLKLYREAGLDAAEFKKIHSRSNNEIAWDTFVRLQGYYSYLPRPENLPYREDNLDQIRDEAVEEMSRQLIHSEKRPADAGGFALNGPQDYAIDVVDSTKTEEARVLMEAFFSSQGAKRGEETFRTAVVHHVAVLIERWISARDHSRRHVLILVRSLREGHPVVGARFLELQRNFVTGIDAVGIDYQGVGMGTQLRIAGFKWMIQQGLYQYRASIKSDNGASRIALERASAYFGVKPRLESDPDAREQFYVVELPHQGSETVPGNVTPLHDRPSAAFDFSPTVQAQLRDHCLFNTADELPASAGLQGRLTGMTFRLYGLREPHAFRGLRVSMDSLRDILRDGLLAEKSSFGRNAFTSDIDYAASRAFYPMSMDIERVPTRQFVSIIIQIAPPFDREVEHDIDPRDIEEIYIFDREEASFVNLKTFQTHTVMPGQARDASDERAMKSILQIWKDGAFVATAFVVGHLGRHFVLMTARHAVEDFKPGQPIPVVLSEGAPGAIGEAFNIIEGKIRQFSSPDLAWLLLPDGGTPHLLQPIQCLWNYTPVVGDVAVLMSVHPEHTHTEISDMKPMGEEAIQTPSWHAILGNSGSPLLLSREGALRAIGVFVTLLFGVPTHIRLRDALLVEALRSLTDPTADFRLVSSNAKFVEIIRLYLAKELSLAHHEAPSRLKTAA